MRHQWEIYSDPRNCSNDFWGQDLLRTSDIDVMAVRDVQGPSAFFQAELTGVTTACNSSKREADRLTTKFRDRSHFSTAGRNSPHVKTSTPSLPGHQIPFSLLYREPTQILPLESALPAANIAGGSSKRKQSPEPRKTDEQQFIDESCVLWCLFGKWRRHTKEQNRVFWIQTLGYIWFIENLFSPRSDRRINTSERNHHMVSGSGDRRKHGGFEPFRLVFGNFLKMFRIFDSTIAQEDY